MLVSSVKGVECMEKSLRLETRGALCSSLRRFRPHIPDAGQSRRGVPPRRSGKRVAPSVDAWSCCAGRLPSHPQCVSRCKSSQHGRFVVSLPHMRRRPTAIPRVQAGWDIVRVGHGSGNLSRGGFYVTYADPATGDAQAQVEVGGGRYGVMALVASVSVRLRRVA